MGTRKSIRPEALHEDLVRDNRIEGGSDRAFGITFSVVFFLVAGVQLWNHREAGAWVFVAAGAAFMAIAWAKPDILHPLNTAWTRLGLLLYKVVNPIVIAAIFALAIIPVGMTMRIFGKDPLRLARDRAAASYWIPRDPPGPDPRNMTNQF